MQTSVISFGYKPGIPLDVDVVVRLPGSCPTPSG